MTAEAGSACSTHGEAATAPAARLPSRVPGVLAVFPQRLLPDVRVPDPGGSG